MSSENYFVCPQCGEEVRVGSKSCPGCGSDDKAGWSEESSGDGLDLPEEEFDYEEFCEKEFGKPRKMKPATVSWWWWLVAVGLLLAFAIAVVVSRVMLW